MGKVKRAAGVVVSAAVLVLAAVALAVTPKAGHYAGFTSASAINGFRPPVSFKLATGGHKITAFTYASFGCFGAGGFGTGDPWTSPYAIHKVGNISVSSKGKFSVKNVSATYKSPNSTTVTTTSVTGKFKTKTSASGTITFSQKLTFHGHTTTCGVSPPASVTFSVKRK